MAHPTSESSSLRYRGLGLEVEVKQDALEVRARASNPAPLELAVVDAAVTLAPGETRRFDLHQAHRAPAP